MPADTKPAEAPIGYGPTMLPVTALPDGVRKAYTSGPDIMRDKGRTVAYALRVRANARIGEREFSAEINMHEAVLLRRYYEELGGGTLTIEPSWIPYLQRLMPLDQQQLQIELNRMREAFRVPRQNSMYEILPLYLGTEPAGQLTRLHEVMRKQMDAWAKLVEVARGRIPVKERVQVDEGILLALACEHITARELEEVANIADPGYNGADQIELPEILAPAGAANEVLAPSKAFEQDPAAVEAAVNAEMQDTDPQLELIESLKGAGCSEAQALQLTSLVDLAGGAGPLTDEDIGKVLGSSSKAKLAAVRRVLPA